jgi:hypothetical protein
MSVVNVGNSTYHRAAWPFPHGPEEWAQWQADSCKLSDKLKYTIFPNVHAKTAEQVEGTWPDLIELLKAPPKHRSKKDCKLLKLATFGDVRSDKKSLRHDDNLLEMYGIEGDYDGGIVTPTEAARRLRAAGVEALVYTSASHGLKGQRWRVFAPLSKPHAPDEHARLVALLNGALGGILGGESWTRSQTYYFGQVNGVTYELHHVEGDRIDELALFIAPIGKTGKPKEALEREPDAEPMEHAVGDGEATEETMMELRSAAAFIVKKGLLKDYNDWTKFGEALATLKGTAHEAAALKILETLSTEPDKVEEKWPTYVPTRTGYQAIFKQARAAGWELSAKEIIEYLQVLPQEEILKRWTRLMRYASRAVAEESIAEVARLTGKGVRPLKAALKDEQAAIKQARAASATQARVGSRKSMLVLPEDQTKQANEVEELIAVAAQPGEFVSFGGVLSQVAVREIPYTHLIDNEKEAPPPVPQLAPLDKVAVLAFAERVVVFNVMTMSGPQPVNVPHGIIEIILKKREHAVPKVTGLILHPVVLTDGTILMKAGLDAATGLYLYDAEIPDVRPYTQDEARVALTRLRDTFLEGFEFRSELDADAALSMLFTGVERRLLAEAPGYALLAARQSSGKTTLARRAHVVLTQHDMPVTTYPDGHEEEMQKRLLAAYSRAPTMIVFDNLADGTTLQSSALALAMTSAIYRQRVLGESREIDAPSNVLMVATGNNVKLGSDELTRWLSIWLEPSVLRPQERVFAHPDVVGHARQIRTQVLRDVLGIIAGYLKSGAQIARGTRFNRWDKLVRQPLLWAGASDLQEVFTMNTMVSEDEQALEALHTALHTLHGSEEFGARDVVKDIESHGWGDGGDDDRSKASRALEQVLGTLGAKDVHSLRSVGKALSGAVGKPSLSRLQLVSRPLHGLVLYRVQEWKEGQSFSFGKSARAEDLV